MANDIYTASPTRVKKNGTVTALKLFENGSLIATATRPFIGPRATAPFEFKFFSTRARARFNDFCDCLDENETAQILLSRR